MKIKNHQEIGTNQNFHPVGSSAKSWLGKFSLRVTRLFRRQQNLSSEKTDATQQVKKGNFFKGVRSTWLISCVGRKNALPRNPAPSALPATQIALNEDDKSQSDFSIGRGSYRKCMLNLYAAYYLPNK